MSRSRLGVLAIILIATTFIGERAATAQGAPNVLKLNEFNVGEGTLAPRSGPFIEIFNSFDTPVALGSFRLANSDQTVVIALPDQMLAAGDFWVVCSDAGQAVENCDQMSADLDTLLIDPVQTLEVLLSTTWFVEDTVDFGTAVADPVDRSGVTTGRIPNGGDNNEPSDFALQCPTPGAINRGLGFCGLVVNEVDYDQGDDDDARFVEIAAYDDRDISCYALIVSDPDAVETLVVVPPDTLLDAGDYYVFCDDKTATDNCDLQFDESAGVECKNEDMNPLALGDTGKHGVAIFSGRVRLDSLSYNDLVDGYTEGVMEAVSDLASPGPISINRTPDLGDTEENVDDFVVACSTPGAANAADLTSCELCGTGVVEGDEDCDEGGEETADCDADCTAPECGDGVFNAEAEVCDSSGDGSPACTDECAIPEDPPVDDTVFTRGSGGCSAGTGTVGVLGVLLLAFLVGIPRRRRRHAR